VNCYTQQHAVVVIISRCLVLLSDFILFSN